MIKVLHILTVKALEVTVLGLLLVLAAACSQDEEPTSAGGIDTQDAVSFTISSGKPTRAFTTFDNYWTADQKISVRGKRIDFTQETLTEESKVFTYKASATSTASEGRVEIEPDVNGRSYWTHDNTFFWSTRVPSRTFSAWYPAAASEPSGATVPADQTVTALTIGDRDTYYDYDILYAPAVTVGFKQTVDLTFYHQLCRIIVTLNTAATKRSKPVTDVKFGKNNIARAGTITTLGSTGSGASGTKTVWNVPVATETITMRLQSADNTNHIYTYECIVPPQSLEATETLFQITMTDSKNSTTLTKEYVPSLLYQDAPNFQAGYLYNFSVTLSAAGMVNISTVQVYDWTTESVTGLNADVPDAEY